MPKDEVKEPEGSPNRRSRMICSRLVGERTSQPGIYQAVLVHCWDGLGGSQRLENENIRLLLCPGLDFYVGDAIGFT